MDDVHRIFEGSHVVDGFHGDEAFEVCYVGDVAVRKIVRSTKAVHGVVKETGVIVIFVDAGRL
jgi:hypothetical protein